MVIFYIDKTAFIKEWWESGDDVTLIARPRRFGKTLNMSMLEQFFSIHYADRGDLFEGLSIWNEKNYRKLQGTYPVISISFARVKESDFEKTKAKIYEVIRNVKTSFDVVTSNRESGFGRYDVVIEPNRKSFSTLFSFAIS